MANLGGAITASISVASKVGVGRYKRLAALARLFISGLKSRSQI